MKFEDSGLNRGVLLDICAKQGIAGTDAQSMVAAFIGQLSTDTVRMVHALMTQAMRPNHVFQYGDGWLVDLADDPYGDGDSRRVYIERDGDDWAITGRGEAADERAANDNPDQEAK